jgi:hypothetical protein
VSPGISVFSEPWDLSSAVKLLADDPSVAAYPIVQGVRFVCSASRVYPIASPAPWDALQGGYGPAAGAPYGKALFFDVASGTLRRLTGFEDCRRASQSLPLAPLVGSGPE